MARLPKEHIERIKQEVSLLRLVESSGYTVTQQGKDHVVSCPFHPEKTPSCKKPLSCGQVAPEKIATPRE